MAEEGKAAAAAGEDGAAAAAAAVEEAAAAEEEEEAEKAIEINDKSFLINLIDSPGHVDFSSEVRGCGRGHELLSPLP